MQEVDTTGVPPLYVFLARWSLIVVLLALLAAMLWAGKITSDVALPLMAGLVAAAGISPVGPTATPITLHMHQPGIAVESTLEQISAEVPAPRSEAPSSR